MTSSVFPVDLSDKEKELVKPFFTNTDKHIFALRNLPEVIQGTLFSRYSRSDKSARRLLLDEFIPNKEVLAVIESNMPKTEGVESSLAVSKAEDFYQRVLVGYGDDSVAELAGCHVACENISSLAGDLLTDSRLGISPLEKSARYIPFDKKVDGKYLWHRSPAIMDSRHADRYEQTHNMIFDLYCKWLPIVISYAKEQNPKTDDTTPRAYENAIRAKACDVLKNMLTAGRLTNVGLFGNGRSFEYLLVKLYSSELAEGREMAAQLHEELSMVMPAFVKRAQSSEFLTGARESVRDFAAGNITGSGSGTDAYVKLVEYDRDAETKILAAMLYPHSSLPIDALRQIVGTMSEEKKKELVSAGLSKRRNRRDKPGRPFENAYYTFEIVSNYGMFRDLHRHRVLTLDKQVLTTSLGFDVPPELKAVGLDKVYEQLMKDVGEVHKEIAKDMPVEAQYIVPRSYHMRYYMKMNLREVYHLTELRSTKQGHPDYRKIAQNMKREVEKVHPTLLEFIQVDMNDYTLARMESERRIDKKLEELDKKPGSG